MKYEEKIVNGVLHSRSTPDGEFRPSNAAHAVAVNALLDLTDEQRMEAFGFFCTHCGTDNPRCWCWNDE